MALSKVAALLSEVPLFARLSQRQLNRVAKASHQASYPAATVVLKEGDVGQKLVLITEGEAAVIRKGKRIAIVGRGDVVGEMSLIDARPRSASVVAETDLDVVLIFRTDFRRLLNEIPAIWEGLLVAQTARLRAADRDLEALG